MFPVEYALLFIAAIILAMFFVGLKVMFWGPIKYRLSRIRYPNKRPSWDMKRQQYGFQCEQRGWVRAYPMRKGDKRVRLRDSRNGWGI